MNRDLINKILYYGTLSPSAHNTQPWYFSVSDSSIQLYLDERRALSYSDPNKWETYLSLGACLANLVQAAKALNVFSSLKVLPVGENDTLIAEILLKETKDLHDKQTLEVLNSRQTNRSRYSSKPVSRDLILNWKRIAESHGVKLLSIEDRYQIKKIANLHQKATEKAFSDPKFREELSRWVRNSFTKAHDGMPGYSTNIPLPMSFVGSWMIKNFNIGKMQGLMEKGLIESSPVILIYLSSDSGRRSLLEVGQAFEEIALNVTKEGLACAPLGAVPEVPSVSKELKSILKTNENLLMLVRVGYSNKKYKEPPKRTVQEVLVRS